MKVLVNHRVTAGIFFNVLSYVHLCQSSVVCSQRFQYCIVFAEMTCTCLVLLWHLCLALYRARKRTLVGFYLVTTGCRTMPCLYDIHWTCLLCSFFHTCCSTWPSSALSHPRCQMGQTLSQSTPSLFTRLGVPRDRIRSGSHCNNFRHHRNSIFKTFIPLIWVQ